MASVQFPGMATYIAARTSFFDDQLFVSGSSALVFAFAAAQ
jgi:hypothetical protein